MVHKVIGFADGENLLLRYQDMCKDGKVPKPEVVYIPDLLVWHPAVTDLYYCDIARISYYQTVVGDQNHLDTAKQQICGVGYRYSEHDTATPAQGSGTLQPRIFKKERKSAKTKSVDINLTVDMLRYATNSKFDVLLLMSGDGDYLPLVEEVARQGKQVWIGSFSKGLNKDLRFAADEFINFDEVFFQ